MRMTISSLTVRAGLTVMALATAAAAQNATYSYFGTSARQGCSPVQPSVTHAHLTLPRLGTNLQVRVQTSNGDCGYLCNLYYLLTGFSRTITGSTALPAPLGCGQVLVAPDIVTPIPHGTGLHLVSLPVPANPALIGLPFYQQALAVTFILGSLGPVAPGNGGHGVIGY